MVESRRLTASHEDFVGSILITKLGCVALSGLLKQRTIVRWGGLEDACESLGLTHEFDSNLLVIEHIRSLKNDTKRSLSNLLPHPVVHTDNI